MKVQFSYESGRTPGQLQAVLRSERFLRDYATATYAIKSAASGTAADSRFTTELTRTNLTNDVPGPLRRLIGDEVNVREVSTWPAEIEPAGCTIEETVTLQIGSRHGLLTGTAQLAPAEDGGCTYTAEADFHLHGVPSLLKGRVESLVAEVITSAMGKKLRLADTWSPNDSLAVETT